MSLAGILFRSDAAGSLLYQRHSCLCSGVSDCAVGDFASIGLVARRSRQGRQRYVGSPACSSLARLWLGFHDGS